MALQLQTVWNDIFGGLGSAALMPSGMPKNFLDEKHGTYDILKADLLNVYGQVHMHGGHTLIIFLFCRDELHFA